MRLAIFLVVVSVALAQEPVEFEGRSGLRVENDRLALIVLSRGGAFASLTLQADPEKLNPLWNPLRGATEQSRQTTTSLGHFVCVDGFGPVSQQERAAGLPFHGEASGLPWELVSSGKTGGVSELRFRVHLPLVQENLVRTVRLVDGENVVYVDSELENLLPFDHPMRWAEHATIGSPFLVPGLTVVDVSAGRCQVRPHDGAAYRRLASEQEFQYPMAPARDGSPVNLRAAPDSAGSMDHITCAIDPAGELGWVTALRTDKRLLLGYLFRRQDFPWIQQWMQYRREDALARGLEFSTQPYDLPLRTVVDMGRLFGIPTYGWLPAKSKVATRFLMFHTTVPEGFTRVDDVRWRDGKLTVEERAAARTVTLAASRTWQ